MLANFATVAALISAVSVSQVQAHGFMYQPLAKFFSSSAFDITSYVSLIDGYALYPDGTFSTAPTTNVESFVSFFEKDTYANIKEFIEKNQVMVNDMVTTDCGYSDPSQTSYGAVNSSVYWGQTGFVAGHEGPCEVWCDDNLAAQNMNCALNYGATGSPSEVPIDTTKCTDASRLTFYWIAMHGPMWQVYINCVNINGATSPTTTAGADKTAPPAVSGSGSTPATEAPATTTAAPATTTAAPATTTSSPASVESSVDSDADTAESASSSTDDEYDNETEAPAASTGGSVDDEYDEDTPEPTTTAPAATTATPAATTATPAATTACRRRMRA